MAHYSDKSIRKMMSHAFSPAGHADLIQKSAWISWREYRIISTNAYLVLKSACLTLIRTKFAGLSRFRVLNTLSDVILQKVCQAATVVVLALCVVIRLNRSLQSTACSLLKNWRNMPSVFVRNTTMLFSALKGKITGTRS